MSESRDYPQWKGSLYEISSLLQRNDFKREFPMHIHTHHETVSSSYTLDISMNHDSRIILTHTFYISSAIEQYQVILFIHYCHNIWEGLIDNVTPGNAG
jgi:hypothetical protein